METSNNELGVDVTYPCNAATLKAEIRNCMRPIPVEGLVDGLVLSGWFVWPLVIQHRETSLIKY